LWGRRGFAFFFVVAMRRPPVAAAIPHHRLDSILESYIM
jgi:hypothetical protein